MIAYNNFFINTEERWKNNRFNVAMVKRSYLPHPDHLFEHIVPHLAFSFTPILIGKPAVKHIDGVVTIGFDKRVEIRFKVFEPMESPAAIILSEYTPWCTRPWIILPVSTGRQMTAGDTYNVVFEHDVISADKTEMFLSAARMAILRNNRGAISSADSTSSDPDTSEEQS